MWCCHRVIWLDDGNTSWPFHPTTPPGQEKMTAWGGGIPFSTGGFSYEHMKLASTYSDHWSIQLNIAYTDWQHFSRVSSRVFPSPTMEILPGTETSACKAVIWTMPPPKISAKTPLSISAYATNNIHRQTQRSYQLCHLCHLCDKLMDNRTFSVLASHLWNSLPKEFCLVSSSLIQVPSLYPGFDLLKPFAIVLWWNFKLLPSIFYCFSFILLGFENSIRLLLLLMLHYYIEIWGCFVNCFAFIFLSFSEHDGRRAAQKAYEYVN